jgi:hypothetical protein
MFTAIEALIEPRKIWASVVKKTDWVGEQLAISGGDLRNLCTHGDSISGQIQGW